MWGIPPLKDTGAQMSRRRNAPPPKRGQELGGTVQLVRVRAQTLCYHNSPRRVLLPSAWERCTYSWVLPLARRVSLHYHCGSCPLTTGHNCSGPSAWCDIASWKIRRERYMLWGQGQQLSWFWGFSQPVGVGQSHLGAKTL